ncbi:SIS domain-containing protein [Streptomyces sp. NPDC058252]|uniref:D-sedoheptulose-7-phosphate isomerase n=1 Tax=Streptomyces sp. NPDC058252 TaxID=3346405 RepID=UPI0036E92CA8
MPEEDAMISGPFVPVTTTVPYSGYASIISQYLRELADGALLIDAAAVGEVAARVVMTMAAGRTVLIAGNGGSATTAGHMACDWLAGASRSGHRVARVTCLSDNIARVTALANDIDYSQVFAQQVAAIGMPNDLLVLLSVSGDSLNLVEAAKAARERGLAVVALLGNAGAVAQHCDALVEMGAGDYGLTEDLHLALNHAVVRILNGGLPHRYGAAVIGDASEERR